jgi:4-hydroxybenzoate polyprenyltransferase
MYVCMYVYVCICMYLEILQLSQESNVDVDEGVYIPFVVFITYAFWLGFCALRRTYRQDYETLFHVVNIIIIIIIIIIQVMASIPLRRRGS